MKVFELMGPKVVTVGPKRPLREARYQGELWRMRRQMAPRRARRMIRFLADADFNHAIVKGRRRHEPAMEFLSANEAELEGVPDPDVLALAAEQIESWSA